MSLLTYWALLAGAAVVGCYVLYSVKKRRTADLSTAVNIFICTLGASGAVRLFGFALSGEFNKVIAASEHKAWFSLSGEDVVFLFVGGIALLWVSLQVIIDAFRKL